MFIVKATEETEAGVMPGEELIADYTIIEVKSWEEAMEWARRFPARHGEDEDGEIEIRQLFELDDFEPGESVERFRRFRQMEAAKQR